MTENLQDTIKSEPLLTARGINKSFANNKVLTDVNLEIKRGEIMALLGENGAGKSTFIKIVTGVFKRDYGQIIFNGEELPFSYTKQEAQKKGVSVIYQELSLIPTLSVAQNVFLGREPKMRSGMIDKKKLNKMTAELIKKYEFAIDPLVIVEKLSIAQRQLVEILKALSIDCYLMIMDEPTASLSNNEVEHLFEITRSLKNKGISILYISHRLKEVYRLVDRITILRDGKVAAISNRDEIEPEKVVSLMMGKKLASTSILDRKLKTTDSKNVLKVEGLTREGTFNDISFYLNAGEVVALSGLVGAGRTEVVRSIYGVDPIDSGKIYYFGKEYSPDINKGIKSGFAFIPEDRRLQGIIPDLEVYHNIGITNLDKIKDWFGMSRRKEIKLTKGVAEKIDIKPKVPTLDVIDLSGGNQQKVVIGRWLPRDIRLLIVDEPTAGVDVGAKDEIYNIIEQLCEKGVSVLLVSSDLSEIVRMSDRIYIMRNGRLIYEFNDGVVNEEDILKAASGYLPEN